jgi:phospholipid/cholesterol/gamma-HCH transport system ATP-binding protein
MIELRQVDFAYGEKLVLRNVSLRIGDEESLVIVGRSGSGKSTILRLILGLETPNSGGVLVDERDIGKMSRRQLQEMRKQMGMVFQDGALFDSLTVGENVGYYLFEHTRLLTSEIENRVREMLGFVDLDADEIIDRLPEELSGGMQRRVAIGRALLSTNPRIMLYDEPTTGLDPLSTENVLNLINKLTAERSISTIVVTHQIADALNLANRFAVIDNGEVVFDGSAEELRLCRDRRVREFLDPFRDSLETVARRKFVGQE